MLALVKASEARQERSQVLVPPRPALRAVGSVAVQPTYFQRGSVGAPYEQYGYPGAVGDVAVAPQWVGAPAALEQGPLQRPVAYSQPQYYAGDVTLFGCGATQIAANSPGSVIGPIRPTRPFKPQGLRFPSNVQNLMLLSVSIAGTNIFASELGVPVELLSEVSTLQQIDWPTLDPAVGVSFGIANLEAFPQWAKPTFYGTQVRN